MWLYKVMLVKGCVKSLGELFSSHFTLASSQRLAAALVCRQSLQKLRQAIYSTGLHLKVRSLNIDTEKVNGFALSFPVIRKEISENVLAGYYNFLLPIVLNVVYLSGQ